jgi:pentatricopeptide repeat protein
MSVWRLVDSYNHEQKVKKAEAKIKEMLNQGFEFSEIRIDGIGFCIRDGEINPSDDAQIPF